jgi:Tfp pilus assembly ATPase PilU
LLVMRTRPSIPFLLDLLRMAMRKQASAIYIVPWMPPTLRIDENSVPLSSVSFTPEQSTLLVLDMLDDVHRAALDRSREVQFSLVLDDVGRFRVHAFRRHGQPAMAIRPYAIDVPTPRTLALPTLACTAVMADRGLLVLAGRSYALRRDAAAALLEHRNRIGHGDLAVLDDATRFWHERVRCQVRQGLNSAGVDELLQRRTLRVPTGLATPGPLAVAWGELRDGPQLERVVRVADRALCLVTLDADDLMTALHRLIRLAGEMPGNTLRHRMAIALNGVLALRPVPAALGGQDLAATEALMTSPDLAANLAEGDLDALRGLIAPPGGPVTASGAPLGGSLLTPASTGADEHLWQLVVQGLVTPDAALRRAVDREGFARRTTSTDLRQDGAGAAATSPVTVDTGFADLFDASADAADPFDFADAGPIDTSTDTQFDSFDWAGDSTRAPGGDLRAVPPAARLPLPTSAQFHAWAPAAVPVGGTAAVDLWMALPGQARDVADRAPQAGDEPDEDVVDELAPVVSLQLRIDGVMTTTPTQRLPWQARPTRARFKVVVPARTRPGAHPSISHRGCRSRHPPASRSRTRRPAPSRPSRCGPAPRRGRRPLDAVDAHRAGLPAGHAEGAVMAAVAEDGRRHRLQEAHPAHAAVAAAPAPGAARAGADGVAVQPHREAELQHLGVGQARVGHVRLHHAGAVEAGPGAGSRPRSSRSTGGWRCRR